MGNVLNGKIIAFLILLCVITPGAKASDFDFLNFTTNDGLPHNYITSIYQSADGFIWLSTRNGICRYDGYQFLNYQTHVSNSSLGISFIQDIMEDQQGNMWLLGPERFLYHYDGRDFKQYSEDYVLAYPDKNGKLWFLDESGLTSLEINSAKFTDDQSQDDNNYLKLVFKEQKNNVWLFRKFEKQQLINSSRGFYKSYELFNASNDLPLVTKLFIDSDNVIWISTSNNGLYRFNEGTDSLRNYSSNNDGATKLSHNNVYTIYETDQNELWIGTMNGINILDKTTQTISYINHDQFSIKSLSDDAVTCFLKDKSGTIFVGTRYGFNVLKEINFEHYYKVDSQNSILNNNVHGFRVDQDDMVWIISSGGLDRLNRKTNEIKNYPVDKFNENALKASPIAITEDSDKNFWIGTWQGGLYHFNKSKETFTRYTQNSEWPNALSNNNVMSLFLDSKNKLWVGTWGGGLNLFNENSGDFQVFEHDMLDDHSITDNEISCFAEDKYGRLWIGSLNGLNLLVDEKNKVFRRLLYNQLDSTTISNNQVNTLYVDDNFLWIGTSNGLNQMNLNDFSIKRYYTQHGLPSNHIKGMVADDENNLWITTNKGLAKVAFSAVDHKQIEHIFTYSAADGLQDNEFLDRSIVKAKSGEIYVGGTNGFNRFNPQNIEDDPAFPDCVFTQLMVDDKEVNPGDSLFGQVVLNQSLSLTKAITLSYKHRSFSLEFASLNYAKPFEVKYKYMLKGFDDKWIDIDSENRTVSYTNINKGEYELLIDYTNNINIWKNDPIRLQIKVIPPFWKTRWFIILLVVLAGLLVTLIIELRTKVIKNQNRKLERTVEERTEKIVKQKNSIEQQKEEIKKQADHILEMNELLKKHNLKLSENVKDLSKARVMQRLLDYNEFTKIFSSEEQCYEYLQDLKWEKGFSCTRCASKDYSLEENNARRCKSCNYKESLTSGTIFHHLRFPIDKAFYILIVTSTGRKINVSELSRTLDMRLKTVWFFHSKVKEELKLLKKPIKSEEGWTSLIITPKGKRT